MGADSRLARTPCPVCGGPTVIVRETGGRQLVLEPIAPVYSSEFDPDERVLFYKRSGDCAMILHRAVCPGRR